MRSRKHHLGKKAQDKKVRVTLNGKLIAVADPSTVSDPAVLKKHHCVLPAKGHAGRLGHGSYVEFRNIPIKEIGSIFTVHEDHHSLTVVARKRIRLNAGGAVDSPPTTP